ncbi:hypothetical protein NEMIN01_0838 [Nematocida minor]|uniref:uncharacterized protein n=1 Tax=Nematocida minor TaxID=1912983 RepID=UPI00221E96BE|nr:uncharacterized protein NEMIN01_0838 [Nematocida minor]KAI5190053.1 hypothetical protein NEMIN01_0838 [Nematocida minor]
MGIKSLWKMINGRVLEMEEMDGLRLCIDGNLALFSCICSSNIVFITEYTLKSIQKLFALGVDPIFVFDGRKPLFKRRRLRQRYGLENALEAEAIEDVPRDEVEKSKMPEKNRLADLIEKSSEIFKKKPHEMEEAEGDETLKHPDFNRILNDQDFSMYQIKRVMERYKYIKSISKQRMHGESNLMFKLRMQQNFNVTEACEDTAQNDFKETLFCIDSIKNVIYKAEEPAPAKNPKPLAPVKNKPEEHSIKIDDIALTEYQRELKMYPILKEDLLLSKESVDKETLPFSYRIIIDILDAFSIKYAIAPSESDSLYRSIEKAIHTDGVVTEDSDVLLFSRKPVYRHVFKRGNFPKVFAEKDSPIEYSRAELHILAWLLGNDYVQGIRKVGPSKAKYIIGLYREAVKKKKELENSSESVDVGALGRAVDSIPEIDIDRDLPALLQLQRIYAEKEFSVKIENLHPSPIDKGKILAFLTKRTTWIESEKEGFFKMVQNHKYQL